MIIGLFIWGNESRATLKMVGDTGVYCLPNGHQNLAAHIHSHLSIKVDGNPEIIEANIGITPGCMAEVHTHDTTGDIHVETTDIDRLVQINLSHFFAIWNKSSEREGYNLEILVDGEPKQSVESVPLTDLSKIELNYTSI